MRSPRPRLIPAGDRRSLRSSRHSSAGAGPRRERSKRASDSPTRGTVAVLTGQQAGLFGGPLFTLLKALTALKLASQVSDEHDVPAVAVFWVEAEDHDWGEVRSCTVFDAHLDPREVALPARAAEPSTPVASILLEDSIREVIDELGRILPIHGIHSGAAGAASRCLLARCRHGRRVREMARTRARRSRPDRV